jgi:hypothetical protein
MAILIKGVFTAKYHGYCSLETCERGGKIQQGDAAQYLNKFIYHMACARRVERGDTAPLCTDCYLYHRGECG